MCRAGGLRPGVAILPAMTTLLAAPQPAPAESDPFVAMPTGTLTVTVELRGLGRPDNPNGVEWHALTVFRRLALELPMLVVTRGSLGLAMSSKTEALKAEQEATMPPPAAALVEIQGEIQKERDAWEDDQQCLSKAGMRIVLLMQEGKMEIPEPPGFFDNERFEHRMVNHRRTCAGGGVTIADEGAWRGDLAAGPGRALQRQGTSRPARKPGAIDLFEFPVDPAARGISGEREVGRIGQVMHAGGYGTTPLGARITWRFVRD